MRFLNPMIVLYLFVVVVVVVSGTNNLPTHTQSLNNSKALF